jgi:hypothetical protein
LGFAGDWRGATKETPAPGFVSQEDAAGWLGAQEPVIAVNLNGEAKAYPLQILIWHEIANDALGGVPIAVTFCPLCNSAFVFDRRVPLSQEAQAAVLEVNEAQPAALDGAFLAAYAHQWGATEAFVGGLEVTFGVSGMLYNSNVLMFDSTTSTLWAQLLGEGNVGTLAGTKLLRYPGQIISFEAFRQAFPGAPVMSRDTGFSRDYGQNPYAGYDDVDSPPWFPAGAGDDRLPPKARVVTLEFPDAAVAFPFEVLKKARAINHTLAGRSFVVFWSEGTASALDHAMISSGRDVGAVGVFERGVNGRELTFGWNGEAFIDEQTGSHWNLLGRATSGELEGSELIALPHDNTLWFAWAAFMPDTLVYGGEQPVGTGE